MKKSIRRTILAKRDGLPEDVRRAKDCLIKDRFLSLPEFDKAERVLLYAAFRSEVETLALMRESLQAGKKVILPRVDAKSHALRLYEIKDVKELAKGYMGIPEPYSEEERLVGIGDIDVAVVPGAAFDASGNRLGYGGGFYDILLSQRNRKMPLIALAYEEQIVESIPAEEHDVKVDMIVTDKRVIRT